MAGSVVHIKVGGIPFSVGAKKTYDYEAARENIMQIRSDSVKNGTSGMTLEQINGIIADYRRSKRASK